MKEAQPVSQTATASQVKQWPGVLAVNKSNLNLHLLHFATVAYIPLLMIIELSGRKNRAN